MQSRGKRVHPTGPDPVRPRVARQDATDHSQVGDGDDQPEGSASTRDEEAGPDQHGLAGRHRKGDARLFQEEERTDDCNAGNTGVHGLMVVPSSGGTVCERSKPGQRGSFSARGSASDETKQPQHDQHDDRQPDQVDQAAGGVEQQPEDEKNDGYDEQRMDHVETSWPVQPD